MANTDYQETDLLIVGCGIAGLSAALSASEAGLRVIVLSKEEDLTESNTNYAQGGIVYKGEGDPELLINDICQAGSQINFLDAVELVAREGARVVKEVLIDKAKVPFCHREGQELDFTREAAHSIRRILYVGDHTGHAIEEHLLKYVQKQPRISFYSNYVAIDLITNTHNSRDPQERYRPTKVIGVYALNNKTGEVESFFAPQVILATGGVGSLYLYTSNSVGATADGLAMAYRVGAEIINAEYIQFHPTILHHRDVKRFLISEALRGEGACLMNRFGEYFMERYNPELKDLAPRDEVARAIFYEMERTDSGYVFLDARLIKGHKLSERFPQIYNQCLSLGIDISKEPIPVVPAAHYFCGGIKVDLDGRTNIPGLWAVGENACTGVHGANRLASVSLLEGLLWGSRAGKSAAKNIYDLPPSLINSIPPWIFPAPQEKIDPVLIYQDMHSIRSTLWNYAGIVRNRKRLVRALSDLNYLSHRIEQFYREAALERKLIELRNAVLAAIIIVKAALTNPISCGCHFVEKD